MEKKNVFIDRYLADKKIVRSNDQDTIGFLMEFGDNCRFRNAVGCFLFKEDKVELRVELPVTVARREGFSFAREIERINEGLMGYESFQFEALEGIIAYRLFTEQIASQQALDFVIMRSKNTIQSNADAVMRAVTKACRASEEKQNTNRYIITSAVWQKRKTFWEEIKQSLLRSLGLEYIKSCEASVPETTQCGCDGAPLVSEEEPEKTANENGESEK